MKKYLMLLCCLLTHFVSCSELKAEEPKSQIRAAFWGMKTVPTGKAQLRRLREHGFNAAIPTNPGFDLRLNLWSELAGFAGEQQMALYPVLNFFGFSEAKTFQGTFQPYAAPDGQIDPQTPCPLDEQYWERAVHRRFLELARLAAQTPLTGAVLDSELYGSKSLGVYREPCFCDLCWAAYFHEQRLEAPQLPAEQRQSYLAEQKQLKRYHAVLEARLQGLLRPLERKIHAFAPHFQIGSLPFVNNWFYRGLIRGLGTETQPLLVFSEHTYITGYTAFVLEEQQQVKIPGEKTPSRPIARYIPGLWLGRIPHEALPSQAHGLASHTGGYWIFTADSLWKPGQKPEPYTLLGTTEEYWKALKLGNERLQRIIDDSETASAGTQKDTLQGRLLLRLEDGKITPLHAE